MPRERSPKHLKASDFKAADREIAVVPWPGTGQQVGVLLLNCAELQQAHLDARRRFRKMGQDLDLYSAEELEAEEMLQQCYLMLVDPSARVATARIFESADQARDVLDANERALFCGEHQKQMQERLDSWTSAEPK